ncbi:MAG: MFS transporter, partial [Ilumatobacteraceae bacterium]
LLMGARGVGVGLGPLIAMRLTRGHLSRVLRVCGLAGLAYSACYLSAAWAPLLPIAAILIVLGHLGGGAQWTLSSYGLQVRTPDAIRGRVMAGDFAIVTLVISVTSLLSGWLAEAVGARWTITVSAIAAGLAGAAYLAATRPVVHRLMATESSGEGVLTRPGA